MHSLHSLFAVALSPRYNTLLGKELTMTESVQSNLNALVLNLGMATPEKEYSFYLGGNKNTKSYVYSMLRILGVKVTSITNSEFTVIVPKEQSFPSPKNEVQFVKFLEAYAKDDSSLNSLYLRDQIWELAVASREHSDIDWQEWRIDNPHEWEELDSTKTKAIKIVEKSDEEPKAVRETGATMKLGMVILFILLSLAVTFFTLANNGIGGSRSNFYDGNFVAIMFKAPAIMLDMIAYHLHKIPLLGPWMPYVLAISILMFVIKRKLRRTEKVKKTIKQRIASVVVNIPYILLKAWLLANYAYFCYIAFFA
jgi:hypothetical protein